MPFNLIWKIFLHPCKLSQVIYNILLFLEWGKIKSTSSIVIHMDGYRYLLEKTGPLVNKLCTFGKVHRN